jgi:hypothetical protein
VAKEGRLDGKKCFAASESSEKMVGAGSMGDELHPKMLRK